MIIVTGAAGFIASNLVALLNDKGYNDLVLVDRFDREDRKQNYLGKKYSALVERDEFIKWLNVHQNQVEFIFHLGARTDTTEFDAQVFDLLNVSYSKAIWNACVEYGIPLIYASSAATYGDGSLGYSDDHELCYKLQPLNPYGESKNEFDKWALAQETQPFYWAGLKFFNVYGPNEYHKGRMASVIMHTFNSIQKTGSMLLFRSHHPNYTDGGQMRDFVYVKDLCEVMVYLMESRKHSGIYNMGTGKARTFLDLAKATFAALNIEPQISFMDTPIDIRDKYQYFTEAQMTKLRESAGYDQPFHTLEEGVRDYVQNYLKTGKYR